MQAEHMQWRARCFPLAGFEGSKFGCRSGLSDFGDTALLT